MIRKPLFLALAAALAGCGLKAPLEPAPGVALPGPRQGGTEPQTAEALLTPPPSARTQRLDELLSRSEERQDDRFDLPPGSVEAPRPNAPATTQPDPES